MPEDARQASVFFNARMNAGGRALAVICGDAARKVLQSAFRQKAFLEMPRKVRELEADLKRAGFVMTPGKGSHRIWKKGALAVAMSGNAGADAQHYQEKLIKQALKTVSNGGKQHG